MAGNLLIVASVLLMSVTVLWIVAEAANLPDDLNEDQQMALIAGVLFAGVFFILAIVAFSVGRRLRQPRPAASAAPAVAPRGRRLGLLVLYLAGSVTITLLAMFVPKMHESLRPIWLLIGQPSIFAQIVFGGILGIKLDPGIETQLIVAAINLLYFLILFYPVYRILTIDRVVQVACYRWMKILLILFVTVHLLLAGAFAALIQA